MSNLLIGDEINMRGHLAKIFRKCINAQRTPPLGLANCWECVFSSPPRGRQNGSTKLIPLLRWRGLAAPLFLTRNLVNSANFSIRFQDFQAEKGARKGDRSFFALVTPSWMEKEGGLRLSSGINFHLGKLCWPSPSARENPFSTESLDFHPSTPRKIPSPIFSNIFPLASVKSLSSMEIEKLEQNYILFDTQYLDGWRKS